MKSLKSSRIRNSLCTRHPSISDPLLAPLKLSANQSPLGSQSKNWATRSKSLFAFIIHYQLQTQLASELLPLTSSLKEKGWARELSTTSTLMTPNRLAAYFKSSQKSRPPDRLFRLKEFSDTSFVISWPSLQSMSTSCKSWEIKNCFSLCSSRPQRLWCCLPWKQKC